MARFSRNARTRFLIGNLARQVTLHRGQGLIAGGGILQGQGKQAVLQARIAPRQLDAAPGAGFVRRGFGPTGGASFPGRLLAALHHLHRRQVQRKQRIGQIAAILLGQGKPEPAGDQQAGIAIRFGERLQHRPHHRHPFRLNPVQTSGTGIAQDAFQIVQHQQYRLADDPPAVILHQLPARAFQQFPQAIRQLLRALMYPIPIRIDDAPNFPTADSVPKRFQNGRRVVTSEHHHRLVMMQPVGHPRRQAGFALPAHAVNQHSRTVAPAQLAQRILQRSAASHELETPGDRHLLPLGVQELLVTALDALAMRGAITFYQPTASPRPQEQARQMPVPRPRQRVRPLPVQQGETGFGERRLQIGLAGQLSVEMRGEFRGFRVRHWPIPPQHRRHPRPQQRQGQRIHDPGSIPGFRPFGGVTGRQKQ